MHFEVERREGMRNQEFFFIERSAHRSAPGRESSSLFSAVRRICYRIPAFMLLPGKTSHLGRQHRGSTQNDSGVAQTGPLLHFVSPEMEPFCEG